MVLDRIIKLPEELCREIYEFIPIDARVFVTKKQFQAYYLLKIKRMDFKNYAKYDTYIRDIVRNRREIVFKPLLHAAFPQWIKPKKWKIKNKSFPDYISYVRYLIIIYDSPRLKSWKTDSKKHLGRKSYKKNGSKNISWSN
jgi:hypothetical protein